MEGATIGYGHLIPIGKWQEYKDGINQNTADEIFEDDIYPAIESVNQSIQRSVSQHEFDALVLLAFNIGISAFQSSSVIKLVNNPDAETSFNDLESAWKAWNKSQGGINRGLVNRRNAEWRIFSEGIYTRW